MNRAIGCTALLAAAMIFTAGALLMAAALAGQVGES